MFSLSSLLESRNCLLHLRTMLGLQRPQKKTKQTETGCNLCLDLRDKERRLPWCSTRQDRGAKRITTWLGMRGRDAARKSTPKVNMFHVFTIDFSEIQFIVNHNSQSDGQNKSAIKTCSSTCHHVSDRALSLFALTSSFLSSASTPSLIYSSPLSWSSSSMWSEPSSTKSTAHPQNEEYCPVAVQNPLTNGKDHITSFWGACCKL